MRPPRSPTFGRLNEFQVLNATDDAAWITLVGNLLFYPCDAGAQITNEAVRQCVAITQEKRAAGLF